MAGYTVHNIYGETVKNVKNHLNKGNLCEDVTQISTKQIQLITITLSLNLLYFLDVTIPRDNKI